MFTRIRIAFSIALGIAGMFFASLLLASFMEVGISTMIRLTVASVGFFAVAFAIFPYRSL